MFGWKVEFNMFHPMIALCGGRGDLLLPMIGIAISPAILGLVHSSAPDLESGLKLVFLMSPLASLAALLLIVTIPEFSMDESDE